LTVEIGFGWRNGAVLPVPVVPATGEKQAGASRTSAGPEREKELLIGVGLAKTDE